MVDKEHQQGIRTQTILLFLSVWITLVGNLTIMGLICLYVLYEDKDEET